MSNPEEKIRAFIAKEFQRGSSEDLGTDYELIDNDLLDSLGIFHLVSFLEREFGVHINDEELVPEHFGTIGSIASLVRSKQRV